MVLVLTEAAYSLHNRVFMGNLRTIILYAVVGTIVNFLLIGKELSSNNTNHAHGRWCVRSLFFHIRYFVQ